jgi:hypothetical protein
MLDTTHVLAGLVLGKYIKNPVLAFGVGVLSHFVLDWLPHWDGEKTINGFSLRARKAGGMDEKILGKSLSGREVGEDRKLQKKHFTKQGKLILGLDILLSLIIFLYLSITGKIWPSFPDINSIFYFLFSNFSLAAGVLGALFPDIMFLLHIWFGFYKPKWFFVLDFHKKIQQRKLEMVPGLISQIILGFIFIFLFLS